MKVLFTTVLLSIFFFNCQAQLMPFVGFGDSSIDKGIITYNVGVEYAFTHEKGFAIAPRVAFSERGGKVDNESGSIRENTINVSYILRQSVKIDEKTSLIIQSGVGMDFINGKVLNEDSKIIVPVGVGLKLGKISTWFEYQFGEHNTYRFAGINLGYSF